MYDSNDYRENPEKYKLFKSARISGNVFTQDGEHDMPAGMYVAIKYRCSAFNSMRARYEPIYTITKTENGTVNRDVYANTLTDFIL